MRTFLRLIFIALLAASAVTTAAYAERARPSCVERQRASACSLTGHPPQENVYAGLLPNGQTPADASSSFDPASLRGATVAIIPSANYNEYAARWAYWFADGNIENYWAFQAAGASRDSLRSFEHNTDPRHFADRLVQMFEPYVTRVIVATDIAAAHEQGATYFLVVDAWQGTPNHWNSQYQTWAGAYLLDSSLQLAFQSSASHAVPREGGDADVARAAYVGATEPVLTAFRNRLGPPPQAQ